MKKRNAFTLAEVLITLGITGIVAAMTLPLLLSKYRNQVLKSQFKKNYSILSQALISTAEELGQGLHLRYADEIPGWNGAVEFRETFNQYLMKIGGSGTKYQSQFVFLPYNPNQDKGDNTMGLGAYPGYVRLADGTAVSVIKNNGFLNVLIDTNGKNKPNRVGYDVFLFVVDKNQDKLISWSNDVSYCSKTATSSYNGRACTYFALTDICPDDPNLGYWECLP